MNLRRACWSGKKSVSSRQKNRSQSVRRQRTGTAHLQSPRLLDPPGEAQDCSKQKSRAKHTMPCFWRVQGPRVPGVRLLLLAGPHTLWSLTSGQGQSGHCEWKRRPLQGHPPPKIFTCNPAFGPIPGLTLSIWTVRTCFIALFVSNRDWGPCLAFWGGAVWSAFLTLMAAVLPHYFIFAAFIEYF